MSAKEKYLRRLLIDAEFYLNNIDNDDPIDLVGDATNAGKGKKHPIDEAAKENQEEAKVTTEGNAAAGLGEAKFLELIVEAEQLIDDNLFEKETFRILSRECIILYIELALRSKKRNAHAEKIIDFFFNHTI